ncbi:MAG TPA: hypothetical protein PLJ10_07885 [Candidatus Hydrogenedens sp.]|nr:hypothetical protein [Candidatus Hydrogenedens sp.]
MNFKYCLSYLQIVLNISIVLFLLIACSCSRWGTTLEHRIVSTMEPQLEEILNDLHKNDECIKSLKGRGTFTLKTPQLDTIYQLHQSDVSFRAPDLLHIIGRKYTATVLRMTCYKDESLIELPTEREFYYHKGSEYFESSDVHVTPLDIFKETFLPERWGELPSNRVVLTSFDKDHQQAIIEIYYDKQHHRLQRRITVEGVPWVLVRNERYSKQGTLISKSERESYLVTSEGIHFPEIIRCEFPQENAFMVIKLTRCVFNTNVEPPYSSISKQVNILRQSGYTPVEIEKR